jgi:hypothetical protein
MSLYLDKSPQEGFLKVKRPLMPDLLGHGCLCSHASEDPYHVCTWGREFPDAIRSCRNCTFPGIVRKLSVGRVTGRGMPPGRGRESAEARRPPISDPGCAVTLPQSCANAKAVITCIIRLL